MWNYRKWYEHLHAIKKNFALLQQSSLSKKEWQGRIWCTHALLWWGKSCYILNQLSSIIRKEIVRLYHDDGLDIFKNIAGPEIEYKRKYTVNVLKNCGLKITTKTNITSTIFLDLWLNLKENTYKPYWKPNSNSIISTNIQTIILILSEKSQNQFVKDFQRYHVTEMCLKKLCLSMKLHWKKWFQWQPPLCSTKSKWKLNLTVHTWTKVPLNDSTRVRTRDRR